MFRLQNNNEISKKTMVFKFCGSMLPIVAVVVWGSIVQGRIFSRNFAPERQSNG